MADPFSVTGTAVGITSLGIQTLQALFQYYTQFRGLHEDLDDILNRIVGLQGVLESLTSVKERIELDNHAPSSELHSALRACEEILQRLKTSAEKCVATKYPDDPRDRLRLARKRLLWPFRRDTVLGLQTTLNGFQDNLSLALQLLGLDETFRKLESLQTTADAALQTIGRVEHQITEQMVALHHMHDGLRNVVHGQQQQGQLTSYELSGLRTELSLQMASVEQKVDLLISGSGVIRNLAHVPPSLLVEAQHTIRTVPRFRKNLQKYNHRVQELSDVSQNGEIARPCRCYPTRKRSWNSGRWVSFYSEEISQHEPDCPKLACSDFSKTVEARFVTCTRFLRLCVHIGLQQSISAGIRTISPVLRYRNVVPENFGAFKPFHDAERLLSFDKGLERTQTQFIDILADVVSATKQMFGTISSPTDVDETGASILHVAGHLLLSCIFRGLKEDETVLAFLNFYIAQDVPLNEENNVEWTPIAWWNAFSTFNTSVGFKIRRNILHQLAKTCETWSISMLGTLVKDARQEWYDGISEILSSEEIYDALEEDIPFLRPILRRSETEFASYLRLADPNDLEMALADFNYMVPLSTWPQGVNIFIASGLVDGPLMAALWDAVLKLANTHSILEVLSTDVKVTFYDWSKLHFAIWENGGALARYNAEQHRVGSDRDVFLQMAKALPIWQLATPSSRNLRTTPYHTTNLTLLSVECLWESGHRAVDEVGEIYREGSVESPLNDRSTPLWISSRYSGGDWDRFWPVAKWLIGKGARVNWTCPILSLTPAHNIVGRAYNAAIRSRSIDSLLEIEEILLDCPPDGCTCLCSQGGCRGIHYPFRMLALAAGRERMRWFSKYELIPYLLHLADKTCSLASMGSAILRAWTFSKLGLTHTCCFQTREVYGEKIYWIPLEPTPPCLEEIEEIRDIERADIDLLEALMTEFEAAWANCPDSFVKFIAEVWKPRIQEIRKSRQQDKKGYRRDVQMLGVKLDENASDSSNMETSDEDTDSEEPELNLADSYGSDQDEQSTTMVTTEEHCD